MQATMEPPQPRPRAWQDAGLVTAAAPGSMPWPPAPTPPQQQHHHDHPQQLPALGAFLPTMPPPPLRPQPHAAAAAGPSYAASTATAAATRGAGIVVPLSRPLSKPQPLAGPTAVQASYFELQPPLRTPPGPRPAPTQVNPNGGGLHNTPSTAAASASMLLGDHKQQRPRAALKLQQAQADEDDDVGEGRIVQRRRVGPPPVAHGWVLAGDRVLRVARQAWEETMGGLLNERRFGQRQAEGFMHMMEGFRRGNQQRNGATADPSAGIIPALRRVLAAGPALDGAVGTGSGGPVGPLALPPSHRRPSRVDVDPNPYDALYRRLATDESACYLIEESVHGQRTVRCSARMADMFVSTEELQGLVDQTGLAVGHLMLRLVQSPYGVERLARDLAGMCFDKYSGKSSIDAQVTCQTRTGQPVRCLSTIGVFIDDVGRHILIFRLWPLVSRDLVVVPKTHTKQQAPLQPQPQPQPQQAQQQRGYYTPVDTSFARSDTPTTTTTAATGFTTAGRTHSTDSSSSGSSYDGSMSDSSSSCGGGGDHRPHPPFYHYHQRQQQQQHPAASAAARAALAGVVPRPLVYDAHGRPVLSSTIKTQQDTTRRARVLREEHKADEQQQRQQQRRQQEQQQGMPPPPPPPMAGVSGGDDVASLTSISSGGSGSTSISSTSSPAAVVASQSPPQRQRPGNAHGGMGAAAAAVLPTSPGTSSSEASEAGPEERREQQPEGQSSPPFLEQLKLTSDEGDAVSALLGMRGRVGSGSSSVR